MTQPSPRLAALAIGIIYGFTLVGAWMLEAMGFLPCELCLQQRWAYYGVIPVSLLLATFNPSWLRYGLGLVALALAGNAIFGGYHAGVEWGFWAGPTPCSGGSITEGLPDLSKPAVLCNEVAIRILGLSLAAWNSVISGGLALVAGLAAYGSSSASQ
jgi:disulfide bond formation protein DsbB